MGRAVGFAAGAIRSSARVRVARGVGHAGARLTMMARLAVRAVWPGIGRLALALKVRAGAGAVTGAGRGRAANRVRHAGLALAMGACHAVAHKAAIGVRADFTLPLARIGRTG